MDKTYDALREIAEIVEIEDYDILVKKYQNKKLRDYIIAKVFCDNIGYLVNRASKYETVEDEDKSSYALEAIHEGMCDYDFRDGVRVISLIGLYFEQKLKNEVQAQKRLKRKANNLTLSLDNENNDIDHSEFDDGGDLDNYNVGYIKLLISETDILTENQKKFCLYLLDNGGGYSDILEIMNERKGQKRVSLLSNI